MKTRAEYATEAMQALFTGDPNLDVTLGVLKAWMIAKQMEEQESLNTPGFPKDSDGLFYPNQIEIDFFKSGNKIHAIKEMRTRTGCGLKEAKDAYEKYCPLGYVVVPQNKHQAD